MALKRITFRADEEAIAFAREQARRDGISLSAASRMWLEEYAQGKGNAAAFRAVLEKLRHIKSHGPYTRDEMNES